MKIIYLFLQGCSEKVKKHLGQCLEYSHTHTHTDTQRLSKVVRGEGGVELIIVEIVIVVV